MISVDSNLREALRGIDSAFIATWRRPQRVLSSNVLTKLGKDLRDTFERALV